mgnify:CR=1 FL=1
MSYRVTRTAPVTASRWAEIETEYKRAYRMYLGDAKRARLGWPADPAPWEPVGRARLHELASCWQAVLGPDGPAITAR